jgi:hypothetical protein
MNDTPLNPELTPKQKRYLDKGFNYIPKEKKSLLNDFENKTWYKNINVPDNIAILEAIVNFYVPKFQLFLTNLKSKNDAELIKLRSSDDNSNPSSKHAQIRQKIYLGSILNELTKPEKTETLEQVAHIIISKMRARKYEGMSRAEASDKIIKGILVYIIDMATSQDYNKILNDLVEQKVNKSTELQKEVTKQKLTNRLPELRTKMEKFGRQKIKQKIINTFTKTDEQNLIVTEQENEFEQLTATLPTFEEFLEMDLDSAGDIFNFAQFDTYPDATTQPLLQPDIKLKTTYSKEKVLEKFDTEVLEIYTSLARQFYIILTTKPDFTSEFPKKEHDTTPTKTPKPEKPKSPVPKSGVRENPNPIKYKPNETQVTSVTTRLTNLYKTLNQPLGTKNTESQEKDRWASELLWMNINAAKNYIGGLFNSKN